MIKSSDFSVAKIGNTWKGSIRLSNDQLLGNLTITDPFLVHKLDEGYKPPHICFVTVSLSMPWSPDDQEGEKPCWKLIAGVIPDLFPEIDKEMQRLQWSINQGRNFIEDRFGKDKKGTRRNLTLDELQQFLEYLQSLSV